MTQELSHHQKIRKDPKIKIEALSHTSGLPPLTAALAQQLANDCKRLDGEIEQFSKLVLALEEAQGNA